MTALERLWANETGGDPATYPRFGGPERHLGQIVAKGFSLRISSDFLSIGAARRAAPSARIGAQTPKTREFDLWSTFAHYSEIIKGGLRSLRLSPVET